MLATNFDMAGAVGAMADAVAPLTKMKQTATYSFTPTGAAATPARLQPRTDDPESIAAFFRARSARLDSPIFRQKRGDFASATPELRFCADYQEKGHVPDDLAAEIVVDTVFRPDQLFVQLPLTNLNYRVARNPLPYSVKLRFDSDADIVPVRARLRPDPESAKHMFVLARPFMSDEEEVAYSDSVSRAVRNKQPPPEPPLKWFWENPAYSDDPEVNKESLQCDEFECKFWAAPCVESKRAEVDMDLIIIDNKGDTHNMSMRFSAKGCAPNLTVDGTGLVVDDVSMSSKVVFREDSEARLITIGNDTKNDAPVLAAVYLTENGPFKQCEPFLLEDLEMEGVPKYEIIKVLPPGEKIEMAIHFTLPDDGSVIPTCYYGCVNVRLAYFLNVAAWNTEDELPQFYDHVIYMEAPREDGVPVDAMSTPTKSNFPTQINFDDLDESSFLEATELDDDNVGQSTPIYEVGEKEESEDDKVEEEKNVPDEVTEDEMCQVLDDGEQNSSSTVWPTPFKGTPFKNPPAAGDAHGIEDPFQAIDSERLLWKEEEQPTGFDFEGSGGAENELVSHNQRSLDAESEQSGKENREEVIGEHEENSKLAAVKSNDPQEGALETAEKLDKSEEQQRDELDKLLDEAVTEPMESHRPLISEHDTMRNVIDFGEPGKELARFLVEYDYNEGPQTPKLHQFEPIMSNVLERDIAADDVPFQGDAMPLAPDHDLVRYFGAMTLEETPDRRYSPTDITEMKQEEPVKIRMTKSVRENGLTMKAESKYTVVALQNACSHRVEVMLKVTGKAAALVYVETKSVTIEPHAKAKLRLVRNSFTGGTGFVEVAAYPVEDSMSSAGRHYRLQLAVQAASEPKRPPVAPGHTGRVRLDRPTLSFYRPGGNACTGTMRVLNQLNGPATIRAQVRDVTEMQTPRSKQLSVPKNNPFVCYGEEKVVRCGGMYHIRVRFDGGSDGERAAHYHGALDVLANSRKDTVPLFGYVGRSEVTCVPVPGYMRIRNTGERAGYVIAEKYGCVIEAKSEKMMPIGSDWEGHLRTGDEIARSRLKHAAELGVLSPPDMAALDPYLRNLEGELEVRELEDLNWEECEPISLTYAARLFELDTLVAQYNNGTGEFEAEKPSVEDQWHAYFDTEGRVRVANGSANEVLSFRARGAEPTVGRLPVLGDAILEHCADVVRIEARGRTEVLKRYQDLDGK